MTGKDGAVLVDRWLRHYASEVEPDHPGTGPRPACTHSVRQSRGR
jgi:hypothetical protein